MDYWNYLESTVWMLIFVFGFYFVVIALNDIRIELKRLRRDFKFSQGGLIDTEDD